MANGRPTIPGIRSAVNMVWRLIQDGCDAPLTVWLDEMWVPLGKLALAWYTIDLMNIFTAWIGVRGKIGRTRSTRHMGGGRKGRRGGAKGPLAFAAGFDPGEWIGERIYGGEELRHRTVPPGVTFLWSIYGQIERFNYFFMVIDLGSDFIVNWVSSVVRLGYCGNREDAVLLARKPWQQQIGIFGWSPVVWDTTEKSRKLSFWNNVGVQQIIGPGVIYARYNCECLESIGGPGVCGFRLIHLVGAVPVVEATTVIELEPGETSVMTIGGNLEADATYWVEIIVGGIWEFTDMEFFMQAPWRPIA